MQNFKISIVAGEAPLFPSYASGHVKIESLFSIIIYYEPYENFKLLKENMFIGLYILLLGSKFNSYKSAIYNKECFVSYNYDGASPI